MPPEGQVHPGPLSDTGINPAGMYSVTVTVPLVGAAPAALRTVSEYAAPACACVKSPLCVEVMVSMDEPGGGCECCAAFRGSYRVAAAACEAGERVVAAAVRGSRAGLRTSQGDIHAAEARSR